MRMVRMRPARTSILCLVLASLALAASASQLPREELEISVMNGVYENLDAGLVPFEQGPVTLVIRSPKHELRVHSNQLLLERDDAGLISAEFAADVEGRGNLIIDIQSAAGVTSFEDRVEVPRQWLKTSGHVRLEPAQPIERGWMVTFVDYVHDIVGVQIRSQATQQVVDACRTMVSLGFVVLDCDAVQAALARVEVPLPEPGSQFLIRRDLLSPDEALVFDRFAAPAN